MGHKKRVFSFQRGPNPKIERQKVWNLETILQEWELIKADDSLTSFPPGSNHSENLKSLLAYFLLLENTSSKRSAREIFAQVLALLKQEGIKWQASRNDFLWGELFSRYGQALASQGEPWFGAFTACLVPRALKLASSTKKEKVSLRVKDYHPDSELTGDWFRDRELTQDPMQVAICDYLLSGDSSLLIKFCQESEKKLAELRLLALFKNDQILLNRVSKFSSLIKKDPNINSFLAALETRAEGKLSHPSDWLEFGEWLNKALSREESQRNALLILGYAYRVAGKKRAPLANFLFRSYLKISEGKDPYGLLRDSSAEFIPTSLLDRSSALLHLTKELALLFGKTRFEKMIRPKGRLHLNHFERQRLLEITAKEMGRLKGPVMKLGQMVTYLGTDLSAAERSLFDSLWQESSPIPFSTIRTQLSDGQKKALTLDPDPIGCGSISQVHCARTNDGKEYALKILLPGLPDIVKTDFQILRTLLPVARWLAPGVPLTEFYQEMEQGLLREIDFSAEALALSTLKKRFAAFPDIHIPELISEYCTPTTLAMSLERGHSFSDFVNNASTEDRSRAGQAIVRFVVTSVREKFFNSDPHPGNYLFNGPRVTFLDFGAAASWDDALLKLGMVSFSLFYTMI